MRILFVYVLISIAFSTFGQKVITSQDSVINQYHQLIKQTTNSEELAILYLNLAEKYLSTSPDTIIKYAQLSFDISKKENFLRGQIGALGFMGEAYIYKGNLPKTLELGLQAIELSKNLPVEESFIGPTYYNLAEIYIQIGEYEKALIYGNKKVELEPKESQFENVTGAYGYFQKAKAFEKMNELDSALTNLQLSFNEFNSIKTPLFVNEYNIYPTWYNIRAKIYFKQNKTREALNDFLPGLELSAKQKNPCMLQISTMIFHFIMSKLINPILPFFMPKKDWLKQKLSPTYKEF